MVAWELAGGTSRAFVGRRRQMRELEEALDAAAGGSGQLVLVSGEAGIGKTRLCEELAAVAGARGVGVAWSRCWQSEAVPAFWPWEQLERQLHDRRADATPPRSTPSPRGAERSSVAGDADLARLQQFEDSVALVGRAAATGPLLLVIDDLHWADLASIRLLAYLAARLRSLPVLVVGTFRELDAALGTPSGNALADLGRYGQRLSLSGLDAADMPDLIRSVTSAGGGATAAGAVTTATAAAVYRHTQGNPLFARELVRLLDGQGALEHLAQSDEAPPVPATVRGVLAGRLRSLSRDCRTMLATGAVVGDEFSLDVVAAVANVPRDRLLDLVDEALAARVVAEVGLGRYAFTHPLIRSAIYDDLGIARRVRLHERVGEALEGLRARGHDVDLAAVAHHFVRAAPGGSGARAAGYAVEAAEQAMAQLAYESAARLYQHALAALDLDPAGADRVEVLLALAAAHVAAGDQPAARVGYLQAASLARREGRADELARAALGVGSGGGFEVAVADREQVDLLEEALRRLSEEPSTLRAWVTARLSVALSFAASDERRLALGEEALAMARAVGHPAVLAYALAAHCDAIAGPADSERRLQEATEIVRLASGLGDRGTELLGRRLRLVALLEVGDIPAADAEIEAYARLADVIRQPLYSWYVPLWRAMRALMAGDFDACERLLGEAEAVGAAAHSQNAAVLAETLRWYWHVEAGRTEEPLAVIDLLLQAERTFGAQLRVTLSLVLAQGGRLEEARARLDAGATAIAALPVDSEWAAVLGQLAVLLSLIGPHPMAQWAYDALLPYRGRYLVEGIGAAWPGSVERNLGLLAATLGREDDALAHFNAALAANRAAGAPLCVARTLIDAGVALGDRGRLTAALAAYRELGVGRLVAELESMLSSSGPPSAMRPPAEPPPPNVFRREGDVWTVGYAGTVVRLKDVKGLRDLARLLAQPGREIAALDLIGPPAGRPRQGDLGEPLDAQAREAYKRRLVELEDELADADDAGDVERSARAQAERDALLAELTAAYGLGGRPRRVGDTAERARVTVTWRIRDALSRVDAVHPQLGRHLRRSVRTGAFCVYDPAEPLDWSL